MIQKIFFALSLLLTLSCSSQQLQEGDIVFQSSSSPQCEAIKLATHSEYSHCGIVLFIDGKAMVFEAVQPVSVTPLDQWAARGDDGKYEVKRLKDVKLSADVIARMKKIATSYVGKDYDLYFGWADDRLYCSELVWKLYKKAAGVELTALRPLSDYDLSHPAVKVILRERYADKIPLGEKMVSPGDLFNSPLLTSGDPQ